MGSTYVCGDFGALRAGLRRQSVDAKGSGAGGQEEL
jgi:hypothetical protein